MILQADALHIPLADESVQCCVTSPPYWGLRDYGVEGQLGLEPTPEEYVANLVAVFREVKRVLRSDGVVFLNLGDSYYSNPGNGRGGGSTLEGGNPHLSGAPRVISCGTSGTFLNIHLKPKDLVGIPWRVAFALQADGWWLRSDIIWHKPNPMPESVRDRPTKSHEYVFLLTKSQRYYYDNEAVREPLAGPLHAPGNKAAFGDVQRNDFGTERMMAVWGSPAGRNRRTVWTIATRPYKGAHFAVFPSALVEPCVKAGTSERGCCPECGAPWERVVEIVKSWREDAYNDNGRQTYAKGAGIHIARAASGGYSQSVYQDVGWRPTCACDAGDPIPCIVLDPFGGSGTVAMVSLQLGRQCVSMDIKPEYLELQRERVATVQPVMVELA